jgi:hypothetical protein
MGFYTVGEIAALGAAAGETHIIIACNRCERHGKLSLARLVAEYGADMPGMHGPEQSATRGRLNSPPEAGSNRHLRPVEIATPER